MSEEKKIGEANAGFEAYQPTPKRFDFDLATVLAFEAGVEHGEMKTEAAPFEAGTGLLGATLPGQRVTPENVGQLPAGSVVRIGDGSRLIHLHDGLWLWCRDGAWTYDRVERLTWRLDGKSVLCHMPATNPCAAADSLSAAEGEGE